MLRVRSTEREAALFLVRFYMSPPANSGMNWLLSRRWNRDYRSDSNFSVRLFGAAVNSTVRGGCMVRHSARRGGFSDKETAAPFTVPGGSPHRAVHGLGRLTVQGRIHSAAATRRRRPRADARERSPYPSDAAPHGRWRLRWVKCTARRCRGRAESRRGVRSGRRTKSARRRERIRSGRARCADRAP